MSKNWVKGVVAGMAPKGTLHKKLGVPLDQKIPMDKLEKAAHAPGKLGQEARFALQLRHFHHGKKGGK